MGIQPAVRAERTTEHTDVGGFKVKVAVKEYLISVFFFFDVVGQAADQTQTSLFKKSKTILVADPGSVQDFLHDGLQGGRDGRVGLHGEKFVRKGTNELVVLGIFPIQPKQALWIVFKD